MFSSSSSAWFGFSTAYGFGLAFLAAAGMGWDNGGVFGFVHMVAGAAMLGVAEVLTAAKRLRRFGIEEACAWIGWSYLLGGGLWWLEGVFDLGFRPLLILGAWGAGGLASLIVWRWATPGMGAIAALGLFVALSQLPANHLLWLLVAGLGAWPLGSLSIAGHISPEHRGRFGEAFVVFVAMFYVAVHVTVIEERLFAHLRQLGRMLWSGGGTGDAASSTVVGLSLAAMVVVPAVLLALGIQRRFRPAIVLGFLAALASAVSFADRLDLHPVWLVLLAGGALLVGVAIVARTFFSRRPGAEWRGLTALPLAEDRESLQTLEVVATLAAFQPAARELEAEGFAGRGGEFGGGGASAKF